MTDVDASFLERIYLSEAILQFEAVRPLRLRPLPGSAIRGALGHAFLATLCDRTPRCPSACQQPETCRYYSLFERNRRNNGAGFSVPKPMILEQPIPLELEQIVRGGPVRFPFETGSPRPGEIIAQLRTSEICHIAPGGTIEVTVGLLGRVAAALPAIIEMLIRWEIDFAGGAIRLRRVLDRERGVLFDRSAPHLGIADPPRRALQWKREPGVRRLRVHFVTPTLLKISDRVCFDPQTIGRSFFHQCMVRAAKIHNEFCADANTNVPPLPPPSVRVEVIGSRLFHYVLPRYSNRQERRMSFDGVVGWLDLAGEIADLVPFARAAEALHFGQKAAFGLGEVRCEER